MFSLTLLKGPNVYRNKYTWCLINTFTFQKFIKNRCNWILQLIGVIGFGCQETCSHESGIFLVQLKKKFQKKALYNFKPDNYAANKDILCSVKASQLFYNKF